MKSRRLAFAVLWAVLGGTGEAVTSGSIHDGIRYGIVLLTGIFIGFCLL